jgi:hypothetical protein
MSFWEDIASAGHFTKGAFDDAVVKPSTQKLPGEELAAC